MAEPTASEIMAALRRQTEVITLLQKTINQSLADNDAIRREVHELSQKVDQLASTQSPRNRALVPGGGE